MIRDLYCDLWGMDSKSAPRPHSSMSKNHAEQSRQSSLPSISRLSVSQTTKEGSRFKGLARSGSDSRFPLLGAKSGSLRNLRQIPQEEKNGVESKDDGVTKNDSYLYHLMTENANLDEEKNENQVNDIDDEEDEDFPENSDEVQAPEQDSESSEDSEEDNSVESLATITEWKDRLRYERMRTARDFILYAFECITELCENRMELQDRVADKSPYLFRSLYGGFIFNLNSISFRCFDSI
jgi:hypothetical protein